MDDIGKAIVMVGQVLLFITASTVSIFLYNSLTDRAENLLITNTNNNRGDAIINVENYETRDVSGAEVVMAILDLKEKSGDTQKVKIINGDGDGDYTYNSSYDYIYTPDGRKDFNSIELRHWLITKVANSTYEISNYSSADSLVYKKK